MATHKRIHTNRFFVYAWMVTVWCLLATYQNAAAQNEPLIFPGHEQFDASRFESFSAEYSQMGFPFSMHFEEISANGASVFSTLMIMHGPNGIGIDHVGHFAEDLRFAFRKFDFGAFGHEHIVIENKDEVLEISRMPLEGDSTRTMTFTRQPLEQPVFDGTMVYWLLAGLPLEDGYSARMNQWLPESDGVTIRPSVAFSVTGKARVTDLSGKEYDCWVLEARGEQVTYFNYVSDRAPYLIKQVAQQPEQDAIVVLELKSVDQSE